MAAGKQHHITNFLEYKRAQQVMADEMIKFRLDALEKANQDVARTLAKLANSQMEMSADIRVLIKEQMRLTQALRGITSFQLEVKQMHSTQSRLFGRVERFENKLNVLRDDFHVYRAQQDGRNGVIKWMADHWQVLSIIAAVIVYGSWVIREAIGG